MLALIKRELNGFFNSLIAYIVVAAFLLIISLFLWVFPAEFNIMDAGYANLDGLFVLAPFVFIFLVPAITMRFFAEEKRTGTIEMLITKPVSGIQIVIAKYIAGVALVVFSLLPTLIYLVTVSLYSLAPGVDTGGVWGSYAGLLFLGMVFVSIGLFASSLTENQIVAFIVALFISGFMYVGFEMAYSLQVLGSLDLAVRDLGLFSHYSSMGRGVIDSRDVLYFAGIISVFICLTHIQTSKSYMGRRSWRYFGSVLLIVLAVNIAGNWKFVRLDLTSEKRYTLTDATRNKLSGLDDIVYFRVYLEGDLPAEFRRLRNDTREMLSEFSAYSDNIRFEFINPLRDAEDDPEQVRGVYNMLTSKGIEPAQVQMRSGDGTSQRVIFPGALVTYGDREVPVHLMEDHIGLSIQEVLHNSSMALEYKLATAIKQVTASRKERIAFMEGHGELGPEYVSSAEEELRGFYEVDRIVPGNDLSQLSQYKALVFAKPLDAFSEEEKFVLDQYLMHGGSILWLVDPVFADMDSLSAQAETIGLAWDINMDDYFFNYGVRLNPVLIKDLNAARHPFITGYAGGRPQINLLPWNFFPLITPDSDHEVVRNLNLIRTEFISSLDTVEAQGVEKHILLKSSDYSRVMPVPVRISLEILQNPPDESLYTGPAQTVAVLLEGSFRSLFANRIKPDVSLPEGFNRLDESYGGSMIVVADGDIIKNQFSSDGRPLPLGYDRYSGQFFGNKEFILNAVNYLADDSGIIQARGRDVRLRLLDAGRVRDDRFRIQLANVGLPLVVVIAFGTLRLFLRKRRYSK